MQNFSQIGEVPWPTLTQILQNMPLKSLRLAWLKRIFSVNVGAWKGCIRHQLKRFGGLFLFHCNYNIKDHRIPSQFYAEMLQWWAEF